LNTARLAFMVSVSVALAGACSGTGDVASPSERDGGRSDGGRGVAARGSSGTIGSSSGTSSSIDVDANGASSSGSLGAGGSDAAGDSGSGGGGSSGLTTAGDSGTGSSSSGGPSPMPIPCGSPMLCSTTCCFEPPDGGRRGGGGGSYSCLIGACPAGAVRVCVADNDCPVGETCVMNGRRGVMRTCVASPDGGPLDAASGGG
jgi:hypothetical protein